MTSIETEILKYALKTEKFQAQDMREYLKNKFSRQYISLKLSSLVKSGKLISSGSNRSTFYASPLNKMVFSKSISKIYRNKNISEENVLEAIRKEHIFKERLPDNVKSIFEYAFSEMLNNAIEHSQSKSIKVTVSAIDEHMEFEVLDYGIGVFRNIKNKFKLKNELEAIQELMKGKTTTMPQYHSGEGIFFTSKIAEVFQLDSYGYKLIVNNKINDLFIESPDKVIKGTKVIFTIPLKTKRHLSDLFKEYQTNTDSYAFDKTDVIVKLYTYGTIHVSRSQARRIISNLGKFKHITLDFKDVPSIGQAFADEIFRVFQKRNPEIQIETTNMNKAVEFMVKRSQAN